MMENDMPKQTTIFLTTRTIIDHYNSFHKTKLDPYNKNLTPQDLITTKDFLNYLFSQFKKFEPNNSILLNCDGLEFLEETHNV